MDETFDARIVAPAGIVYAGCPFAGKTTHILKLLKNNDRLFTKQFDYIYWFYGQSNQTIKMFEENPQMNVIPVEGLPENIDDYIFPDRHGCHVYDDLMHEASSNSNLLALASKKCHHSNVSWVLVLQNLFCAGKERVSLLRCAHYLVLFKNPLDKTIAYNLASRIMPKDQKCFLDIYNEATSKPNGYLFIDGAQSTPDQARFRTDIFDIAQRVFIPNAYKGSSLKQADKISYISP